MAANPTLPRATTSKLGTAQTSLQPQSHRPAHSGMFRGVWRKLALLLIMIGVVWLAWGITTKIEEEIYEWTHHEEKVHRSRPHLRKVGRYSPEHRYRPAASPIVTETLKSGKTRVKGQYH